MVANRTNPQPQLHLPTQSRQDLTAGDFVVVGPPPGGRRLASVLRRRGIRVTTASGSVLPSDTTAQTRAVVLWVEDEALGLAQCEEIRSWAHESLLPILIVTPSLEIANARMLWRAAFSCFAVGLDDARLLAVMHALDRGRRGLPTMADADVTWMLRSTLRTPALGSRGVGLDAFVAEHTAFIGGLLHETASVNALAKRLLVPATVQVNFDGVRCSAQPACA